MKRWFTAMFAWQTRAVVMRNARSYLRNWRMVLLPTALEPVLLLTVFGIGLGAYMGSLVYQSNTVDYLTYVAPGMLAYTVFSTSFMESLYSSFCRMCYLKTWDAMLTTQLEITHIVWGEIIWSSVRGLIHTTIFALVLALAGGFGWVDIAWWLLPIVPFIAFLAGLVFAAFTLIFCAMLPTIDYATYPAILVSLPLGLTSNTYFPVDSDSPVWSLLIDANPLSQMAHLFRQLLLTQQVEVSRVGALFATLGAGLVICSYAAFRLLKRRVLGP